jgi:hypothetical protein
MTNSSPVSGVLLGPPKQHRHEDEFKQLFPALKNDILIEDYSCALQTRAIIHGRMYISDKHVTFYSTIFSRSAVREAFSEGEQDIILLCSEPCVS